MAISKNRYETLHQRASEMRAAPTASEARLFEAIRGGGLGVAVRRQVVVAGRFIADLYVPCVKLVVEVDGGYHAERAAQDVKRDRALERGGYPVLRLEAALVMSDVAAAVALLAAEIKRLCE